MSTVADVFANVVGVDGRFFPRKKIRHHDLVWGKERNGIDQNRHELRMLCAKLSTLITPLLSPHLDPDRFRTSRPLPSAMFRLTVNTLANCWDTFPDEPSLCIGLTSYQAEAHTFLDHLLLLLGPASIYRGHDFSLSPKVPVTIPAKLLWSSMGAVSAIVVGPTAADSLPGLLFIPSERRLFFLDRAKGATERLFASAGIYLYFALAAFAHFRAVGFDLDLRVCDFARQ